MRPTAAWAALALGVSVPTAPDGDHAGLVGAYRSGPSDEAIARVAGLSHPQPSGGEYLAAVRLYRTGDAGAAVKRFAALGREQVRVGAGALAADVLAEDEAPSQAGADRTADLIAAAAAIHTEVALRPLVPATGEMVELHFGIAASIVDDGVPLIAARVSRPEQKPAIIHRVSPEFRRLWYVAVFTALQRLGRVVRADAMAEKARGLFPADAEILRLSGITDEMRTTRRVVEVYEGERLGALAHAEEHLRASLALAPDQIETTLRLGRVLQQRGELAEARALLMTADREADPRVAYLASLFLGGLEDAAGRPEAAADWYDKAAARMPSAQVARLAASELRHRAGERRRAADDLQYAIGSRDTDDPWWLYFYGEPWRLDPLLDALGAMSRP